MTPRQRMLRCLEFDHPDRVPRQLWVLPIAELEHGPDRVRAFRRRWPDDIENVSPPNPRHAALFQGDPHLPGTFRDDWGCVFENIQAGVIGEVKTPLLQDWSDLAKLRPPVEALDIDRAAVNAACRATEYFTMAGCCPRVFERMQFLRGSENLYLDLADESHEFLSLLRSVSDFYIHELEAWSRTDVDGLMFMDDWGSQRALLISPAQWRRLFKPIYADFARIAHAAGKKLFMHSDGHILDIYQDLVEIGVDAINSQLFCMDIEEIGRRVRGRITFWGEIDRQEILPHGTPAQCRAAVNRVMENLSTPAGGVIAQFELGAGARLENAEALFAAWDAWNYR